MDYVPDEQRGASKVGEQGGCLMGIVKRLEYYVKCDCCGQTAGTGLTPDEAVEKAVDAGFSVFHLEEEVLPVSGNPVGSSGATVIWCCANCRIEQHMAELSKERFN